MNNSEKKLVIGTRTSDLALWQANFIKSEIEANFNNISVELKLIKTKGDKILDVALSKIGDKDLFTKELETALLNNEIDLAVHSLKDLQTDIPKGLKIAAITKRHDVSDVLIAKKKNTTIENLSENAKIATGSLRRKSQILSIRPDLQILELRGNVPTRIQKFLDSDWDGIILAKAGVDRLNLEKHISFVIPLNQILPAIGQGALGIEISSKNKFAEEIISKLNDAKTQIEVTAERAFLKELQGGCQVPIGAFAELKSNGLYLSCFVGSLGGEITFRKVLRGSKKDPIKLGKTLAKDMLKAGAKEILDEIYR